MGRLREVLLAGFVLACACSRQSNSADVDDDLAVERPYQLLLVSRQAARPCPLLTLPDTGSIGTFTCGRKVTPEVYARLSRHLASRRDTSAYLQALIELASAGDNLPVLARTVQRFDQLVAQNLPGPQLLSGAAVANALLAYQTQDASGLLLAVNLIEQAASIDSANLVIAFNRAVLLERLGLPGEAAHAWVLAGDTGQARIQATADARSGDNEPEVLRERGIDLIFQEGPSDSADIDRLGELLGRRGDSTLLLAAREARQPTGHGLLLSRVRAGKLSFDRGEFEASIPTLRAAAHGLEKAGAGVALWGWPAVYLAATDIYGNRYRAADSTFSAVLFAAGNRPLLALRARALWGWALSLARQDRPQAAIDRYQEALRLFKQAGEQSNVAAMEQQLADMFALTGDLPRAARAQLLAARAFLSRRDTGTLQGFLQSLAAFELRAGRPWSALAVLQEAVRVSHRTGRPKDIPEALARLAAAELHVGRREEASRHLAEARAALPAIASAMMREGEDAEVARVEARLFSGPQALASLDRVVGYYQRLNVPYDLSPALVQRAGVRLALADTSAAERDLDLALELVRRRAGSLDLLSGYAARQVERAVFEQRVAIRLARGDSLGALAEIGQAGAPRTYPARLAGDQAVLAWAVLPDRLVIWAITRGGITTRVVTTPENTLRDALTRFTTLIRQASDTTVLFVGAQDLYRLLLQPIDRQLQGIRRIALVSDPVLASLPFAALRNPRGRFLIEDAELTVAWGLREAIARIASHSNLRGAKLLVVGNPAFDRAAHPELPPLRYSTEEIDQVGRLYSDTRRLTGAQATPTGLLTALSRVSILHFSGHAQSTEAGLRGSRLVLAPEMGSSGLLDAERIAALRLSTLKLVVLSACETMSHEHAGTYRLDGLAEAFLAAGARTVVGSLWAVDDQATASLMTRFHSALRRGVTPAAALRAAQLELLHSARPAAWSAFRVLVR